MIRRRLHSGLHHSKNFGLDSTVLELVGRFVWMWVLVFVVGGCGPSSSEKASVQNETPTFSLLKAGDLMPVFEGIDLHGSPVRIGSGNQLTLVNLWATWCGPCIEEFPDLEKLHQSLGSSSFRIVGVNVDEMDDEVIGAFVEELGATFLIALDPGSDYLEDVGAVAMPSTYLVNKDGTLAKIWTGKLTESDLSEIKRIVESG